MKYLHTMVRVSNLDDTLGFYCGLLGMVEVRRTESEKGRYTNIFLAAPSDVETARNSKAPLLELTYNWDPEDYGEGRNFGHLAFEVDDVVAALQRFVEAGGREMGTMVTRAVAGAGTITLIYVSDPEDNIVELQHWHK